MRCPTLTRHRRSPGFAVPPVMFIVAVIATVTGETITLYEAYEKYYVRPAQEVELSQLKEENAKLKQERDLLKAENAKLKQPPDSEPETHPNGAELSRKRERSGVTRKPTELSDRLTQRRDEEKDKAKRVEEAK
jgi:cell division protein FtsB